MRSTVQELSAASFGFEFGHQMELIWSVLCFWKIHEIAIWIFKKKKKNYLGRHTLAPPALARATYAERASARFKKHAQRSDGPCFFLRFLLRLNSNFESVSGVGKLSMSSSRIDKNQISKLFQVWFKRRDKIPIRISWWTEQRNGSLKEKNTEKKKKERSSVIVMKTQRGKSFLERKKRDRDSSVIADRLPSQEVKENSERSPRRDRLFTGRIVLLPPSLHPTSCLQVSGVRAK